MLARAKSSQNYSRRKPKAMSRLEKWISVLIVAFCAPFLAPSGAIMGEYELSYQQDVKQVLQARSGPIGFQGDWTAELYEYRHDAWVQICDGGDRDSLYAASSAKRMSIDVWVGEPGCELKLVAGNTYLAKADWTLNFLIWGWTVSATSDPFTWP